MSPRARSDTANRRQGGDAAGRLTVVIPTYNRPNYLGDSLGSVVAQTVNGFRLVVLDNASTEDYSHVLERFEESAVEYVRNSENLGSGGNFLKAVESFADRTYVTVFHDDDLMHPRMLEWQLEVLESDPGIVFVATESTVFNDGEVPPRGAWGSDRPPLEVYETGADLVRALLGGAALCFGSAMYRSVAIRALVPDLDRFSIYADRPSLMAVAGQGKCALIRAPLVLYRLHPGQDTITGALDTQNVIELLKRYREALGVDWSEGDRVLFRAHAAEFLVNNYAFLAKNSREGVASLLRRSRAAGVLRLRDLRPDHYYVLARASRWGRHLSAARCAGRRLLGRQR
jgi:glycosyltransferase involved in cell wall biosynthesis